MCIYVPAAVIWRRQIFTQLCTHHMSTLALYQNKQDIITQFIDTPRERTTVNLFEKTNLEQWWDSVIEANYNKNTPPLFRLKETEGLNRSIDQSINPSINQSTRDHDDQSINRSNENKHDTATHNQINQASRQPLVLQTKWRQNIHKKPLNSNVPGHSNNPMRSSVKTVVLWLGEERDGATAEVPNAGREDRLPFGCGSNGDDDCDPLPCAENLKSTNITVQYYLTGK